MAERHYMLIGQAAYEDLVELQPFVRRMNIELQRWVEVAWMEWRDGA